MQSQVQVFKIRESKLQSYSSETTPSFMTDFAELMDHVGDASTFCWVMAVGDWDGWNVSTW